MKAEQFIKDCTRGCSNVVYYHNQNFTHGTDYVEGSGIEVQYSPWLTPEQALRAVEIAREELIDTLEVKEVDLEKEIEKEWLNCDLCRENTILEYANVDIKKFRTIVNHFFELGLKTKGG